MPPQPTQRNRACERGAELIRRAALFEEGTVDPLGVTTVTRKHQPARYWRYVYSGIAQLAQYRALAAQVTGSNPLTMILLFTR